MDVEIALFIDKQLQRQRKERIEKAMKILESEEIKEPKMYRLDTSTIETLEDVKVILDGLELIITKDSDSYESVKKYFKEYEQS